MVTKVDTELAILVRLKDQLTKEIRKAKAEVKDFGVKADTAGRRGAAGFAEMRSGLVRLVAFIGGVRFLKSITGDAIEFQQAMSEVSTIVDTSVVDMDALSRAVRELAVAQGENQEIVAKGLYQTISAGVSDAGQALKLLGEASRLAKAGLSTTTEAVDLLTNAINAYGLSTDEAARLSDVFFKTVELGKTTIPELASSLGQIFPIAAQLGVSVEEVAAAIATLTKGGLATSDAVTQVRAALVAFLKHGEDANKMFGDGADLMGSEAIQAKGLRQAFVDLAEATGGNADALVGLVGRVEGASAILALTGAQLGTLDATLLALADSAGAAGTAFEKRLNDPAERLKRLANAASIAFSELGDTLLSTLVGGSEAFGSAEDGAENLRQAIKLLEPVVNAVALAFSLIGTGVAATVTSVVGMVDVVTHLNRLSPAGSLINDVLGLDTDALDKIDAATSKLLDGLGKLADLNVRLGQGILGLGKDQDDARRRTSAATKAAHEQADALRELAATMQAGGRPSLSQIPGGDTFDLFIAQRRDLMQKLSLSFEEQRHQVEEAVGAYEAWIIEQAKAGTLADSFARTLSELNARFFDEQTAAINAMEALAAHRAQAALDAQETKRANDEIAQHILQFQAADAFLRDATDGLVAFGSGAKSAKDAFRDFARSFLTDILRMIIQAQVLKATMAALRGVGLTQRAISTFFNVPSGMGNAFSGGKVVPMAQGGIIGRPTVVPLALMGERGEPEAVLPLSRNADGRLGVQSSGRGGGGDVHLNIGFLDTDGADNWLIKRRDTLVALVRQSMYSDPGLRADVGM